MPAAGAALHVGLVARDAEVGATVFLGDLEFSGLGGRQGAGGPRKLTKH